MRCARYVLVALLVIPLTCAHAAPLININTASATQLDTLPGIGPSKAAAIVDYRTTHGLFTTIEGIQNVKGIGPVTFANLKDRITVGVVEVQPTAAPAPVQPTRAPVRSISTQAADLRGTTVRQVESVTSSPNTHEHAVIAPTTTTDVAAVGAALPEATPTSSHSKGLFGSSWTIGLVGVMLVAGTAFILL